MCIRLWRNEIVTFHDIQSRSVKYFSSHFSAENIRHRAWKALFHSITLLDCNSFFYTELFTTNVCFLNTYTNTHAYVSVYVITTKPLHDFANVMLRRRDFYVFVKSMHFFFEIHTFDIRISSYYVCLKFKQNMKTRPICSRFNFKHLSSVHCTVHTHNTYIRDFQ